MVMSTTYVSEVEHYSLAIHAGSHAAQSRTIWLKLKPEIHALEPTVYLIFGLPNQQGYGGVIEVGNVFQAYMVIYLDEHAFADIYAVLRSEKPVHFRYSTAEDWWGQANKQVAVEGIQIDIGLEPIGEGVETTPLRTLQLRKGIQTLQKVFKQPK
jgi:hypothetical protein